MKKTFVVLERLFNVYSVQHLFRDFKYELNSHPNFPSLKSISDTLELFGFENVPVKLKPDDLEKLEEPFLCYIKENELAYVTPLENELIHYTSELQKSNTITLSDFIREFSGIAVLLEFDSSQTPNRKVDRFKENQINKFLLATILILLVAFVSGNQSRLSSVLFTQWYSTLLPITKSIGLIFTSVLVLKEFGHSGSFVDKVCKVGKQSDCNSVLESKYATVYAWIKWSDLGLIYFLSSLLLVSMGSFGTVNLLALVAFPYTFISLYQQIFLIKKLCPLCLGVITMLSIEFVLGLNMVPNLNTLSTQLFNATLLIIITGVVHLLLKSLMLSKRTKASIEYQYNRLKRVPEVVTTVVKKERPLILPEGIPMNYLTFGTQEQTSLKVQAFLSLHCSHCGRLFHKLDEILNNSSDLNIELFLGFNPKDEGDRAIMEEVLRKYHSGEVSKAWSMIGEWYARPEGFVNTQVVAEPTEALKKLSFTTNYLMMANEISALPKLFVERYEKSPHYELLEYVEHSDMLKMQVSKDQREMIITK